MIIDTNSFEGYTNPLAQWDAFLQGPNTAGGITAGIGRNGGAGFHITSNASGGTCGLQRNIANTISLIAGFAVELNTYPTVAGGNLCLFSFINGGGSLVELRVDSAGVLQFTSNGTNIGSAGTTPLGFGAYHYIQIKTTIDGAAGVVECVLDTTTVISESGLNTGTGGCTAIVLGPGSSPGTLLNGDINIDDFVLSNISDSSTYLGDSTVQAIYPRDVGSFTNFVRGGTDTGANFSQCNEHVPDGDTTYVASSTVGDRDSYKFDSLSLTGQVFGLNIKAYAEKTEAGARSIAIKARSGSTDSPDTAIALTTGYQYVSQFLPTDPATGQPWTVSGLNAAEFGVKVVG